MRLFLCCIAIGIGSWLPIAGADTETIKTSGTIETSEFGAVDVTGPSGSAQGFAIVFSGDQGFSDGEREAIRALTGAGLAVAAIDSRKAITGLDRSDPDEACTDLAVPLEWVSHQAQRRLGFTRYARPALLGFETGAALVYAALAQAPPLAFARGLSADFSPRIKLHRPLCGLSGQQDDGQQALTPGQPVREPWQIAGVEAVSEDAAKFFAAVATDNKGSGDHDTPKTGSLKTLYMDAVQPILREATRRDQPLAVTDLPIVEVSSVSNLGILAIIYSGDGGWRDLDRTLGDLLRDRGAAVVGVDALHYFWSKRTPEETAADLERIIRHYRRAWNVGHIALIGYSFGAEIIPFAYNRLFQEARASVLMLSLLAPGRATDFEIQIFGWVGEGPSRDALSIMPEIRKIAATMLQCFYGIDDDEVSLCTSEDMRGAEIIELPGDHHFDRRYAPNADRIISWRGSRDAALDRDRKGGRFSPDYGVPNPRSACATA
ncbi:MAG: virulence factor family protein [Gammaproteobacteria bacterium]